MLQISIKKIINLGIIFKILILNIFQVSLSLSQNISSYFNLSSNIIFINQNKKNFYIEMDYINHESALFYLNQLNQIQINDIFLNKSNCKLKLNKINCLISKNIINESLSNDIYIILKDQNKEIKLKKIYYTIEILENNLILNILSKEKYFIKFHDKIIKSLNNISKYEINNKLLKDNDFELINISVYNEKNNMEKIGEIYENFEDFNVRQLQNNNFSIEPQCLYLGGDMSLNITLPKYCLKNDCNITIKDNKTFDKNISLKNITDEFVTINESYNNTGKYNVTIKQYNISDISNFFVFEDIKLEPTLYGLSQQNKSKKIKVNKIYSQLNNETNFSINQSDNFEIEYSSDSQEIVITISTFENISFNSPLILSSEFIDCKEEFLCVFNFYSLILNSSNPLDLVKSTNTTRLELNGTCDESFLKEITLFNKNKSINITSNNFTQFECGNGNTYHFNVTFNLTNLTFDNDCLIFNVSITYSDNETELINDFIIPIFNCKVGFEIKYSNYSCYNCKENKMKYSNTSKSCVSNCNNDEYLLNDSQICDYYSCENNNLYLYKDKTCYKDCETINDKGEYLRNNNTSWECENKSFILNLTNSEVDWNDTIILYFKFYEENITNILNNGYEINITIEKEKNISFASSFDCKQENESIIKCKFNLNKAVFSDFYVFYNITKKNETISSEYTKSTLKIINSKYFCDKSFKILKENQCKNCDNDKKYYYNYNCYENCNSTEEKTFAFRENNTTFRCISIDLCLNYGLEIFNNECKCSNGFGFDENYNCIQCNLTDGMLEINRECKCNNGLIEKNKNCVLIENYYDGINITCSTYNPCGINNPNGKCIDTLSEIPFCECNNNYIGLFCQSNINEIEKTINELNNTIISFIENNKYDTDIKYIQHEMFTLYIKEFSNLNLYSNNLNIYEAAEKIVNMTYNIINNFTLNDSINSNIRNIIDYIGFSYFYQKKISSNKLRVLNNNINDNQIIKFYNILFNESDFLNKTKTFSTSSNGAFRFFLFNNTEKTTKEYIDECKRNNIPYISNKINNSVQYIFHITKNQNATSNNFLTHSFFFFYDENNIDITSQFKKELKVNYKTAPLYILLDYYLKKGINIYDSRDIAFRDECFTTNNFNFDLISKFRNSLYQGEFYSEICQNIYINKSIEFTITFVCDTLTNEFSYYFNNKSNYNINLKEYKSGYLSLHCFNDAKNIGKNIAFWLYMILIILIITFSILLFKNKNYKFIELYEIIENDQLDIKTPKRYEEFEELRANHKNKIEYYEFTTGNNGNFSIIIFNFLHYHPLLIITKTSFLCPKWLNCLILIFNISNVFGFNCLLYSNSYLEKRIYNKYRNNFTYPIKYEFPKLIITILISLILTILIKGLNLISYSEARAISLSMIKYQNDNKIFIDKNEYNKFYIRVLMSLIIFVFTFYFWLFCLGFCSIFPKAQISWFYSGIWCMFLNWIVFSPFFLLILSIVEMFSVKFKYHYYVKRLFCF